jgi:hypothetical protein
MIQIILDDPLPAQCAKLVDRHVRRILDGLRNGFG